MFRKTNKWKYNDIIFMYKKVGDINSPLVSLTALVYTINLRFSLETALSIRKNGASRVSWRLATCELPRGVGEGGKGSDEGGRRKRILWEIWRKRDSIPGPSFPPFWFQFPGRELFSKRPLAAILFML